MKEFFLHLVSDSTGSTLFAAARGAVSQFNDIEAHEKFWNFIRSEEQLDEVIAGIKKNPGPVLFTLMERPLHRRLMQECRKLELPCIPVLDPILKAMSGYLDAAPIHAPGSQYKLTEKYFERIDAVDFAMQHDDGQSLETIGEADIILVGVSRTSKTPTCMYLANRGVRAANIPLVPNIPVPDEAFSHPHPMYVGLIEQATRLVDIRRSRLSDENEIIDPRLSMAAYLDLESVNDEIREARKLFGRKGWQVIDVTRRSVEETAAEILMLLNRRNPDMELLG